jgi:phosphatidylserine/phosphatidylglycerophosphate/cardiolipin synthase-like enzyme
MNKLFPLYLVFLNSWLFAQAPFLNPTGLNQNGFTINLPANIQPISVEICPIKNQAGCTTIAGMQFVNNSLVFNAATPATIYRATLNFAQNGQTQSSTQWLATVSQSSGTMKAWFNHPVNTAVATQKPAIGVTTGLRDTLVSFINAAEESLDIAIYNSWANSPTTGISGALNDAFSRGVRVRLIVHGSSSNNMLPHLNENIPVLPRTSPSGLMHHKFVIRDANSSNPNKAWVWSGSTNWTSAQIQGPDLNNVIAIQDQSLARAFEIEFEEMWGGTDLQPNTQSMRFGSQKLRNSPSHFLIRGRRVELYFSPSDGTNARILQAIQEANDGIYGAVMAFTRSDLGNALVQRYENGLEAIHFLFDAHNYQGNQLPTLQDGISPGKAIAWNQSGQMHHKFVIVDHFDTANAFILTGSHNWSGNAETRNDENTLIVYDPDITNQYFQAFSYMMNLTGAEITSISETPLDTFSILVYPNPGQKGNPFFVTIPKSGGKTNLTILDPAGRTLWKGDLKNGETNQINFNTANVSAGTYLLVISSENGKTFRRKLQLH